MMTEAVIVAVVTGLFAIIGQYILARNQCKQREVEDARWQQKIMDRIDAIEKKIEVHNNYIDRTYELEKKVAVLEQKVE